MMKKHSNAGFTLIELVIAIIVLAILAAVALPRFINIKGDAETANIQGVEAALNSALSLVTARIEIDDAQASVEFSGDTIALTERMPVASAGTLRSLLEITVPASWTRNWETIPCQEPEFCILGNMYVGKTGYVEVPGHPLSSNGGQDRASYIWPTGYTLNSDGCYTFYINEASKKVTHSGSVVDGC